MIFSLKSLPLVFFIFGTNEKSHDDRSRNYGVEQVSSMPDKAIKLLLLPSANWRIGVCVESNVKVPFLFASSKFLETCGSSFLGGTSLLLCLTSFKRTNNYSFGPMISTHLLPCFDGHIGSFWVPNRRLFFDFRIVLIEPSFVFCNDFVEDGRLAVSEFSTEIFSKLLAYSRALVEICGTHRQDFLCFPDDDQILVPRERHSNPV